MKYISKIFSVLFSILIIIVFTNINTTFGLSKEEDLLFNPSETIINEVTTSNLNTYGLRSLNREPLNNNDKVLEIKSKLNDNSYFKIIKNSNTSIDIGKNGELLALTSLDNKGLEDYNPSDINDYIISRGYSERYKGYIDTENKWVSIVYQKKVKGIWNPYQSVKLIVDEKNNTVCGLSTIDNSVSIDDSKIISIDRIRSLVGNEIKKDEKLIDINLTFIKPCDYIEGDKRENLIPSYQINTNLRNIYYNAYSAEYIGDSHLKNKSGKVFSLTDIWNGRYSGNMAYDGLSNLGYDMKPKLIYDTFMSSRGDEFERFISSNGSEKGIYVNCHGSTEALGNRNDWYFTREDLRHISSDTRKSRFVFLNACQTGVNDGWARDFGIIPGSWGAFIGWTVNIDMATAVLFQERFWRYANGNRPILKSVQMAENAMPSSYIIRDGEGNYPDGRVIHIGSPIGVRYFGNSTFYGNGR